MMKKITKGKMSFTFEKKGDRVRIKFGDKICTMKAIDLWGVAFETTKDPDMRAQLMPVRQEPIMKFKKVHTVALKNDMKAGETLQFTCNIDVPTHIIEGMRDIIAKEVPGSVSILKELLGDKLSTPASVKPDLKNI